MRREPGSALACLFWTHKEKQSGADSGELVRLAGSVVAGIYRLTAGAIARIVVASYFASSCGAVDSPAGSVSRNPFSADQRVSPRNAGAPPPGCVLYRRVCHGSRAGVANPLPTLDRRFTDYGDCRSASGNGGVSVRLAD